jgi:uncharacterized lipoprotein
LAAVHRRPRSANTSTPSKRRPWRSRRAWPARPRRRAGDRRAADPADAHDDGDQAATNFASTTSGLDANARFSWSPDGLFLLVDDTVESVQRRLGLVIERAGMQRIRVDDNGVYRFEYYQVFEEEDGFFRKLAFWSRDKRTDYSGAYQVFTRADGDRTRVFLKYADGTDCEPDAAEHVLDVIRSRLG